MHFKGFFKLHRRLHNTSVWVCHSLFFVLFKSYKAGFVAKYLIFIQSLDDLNFKSTLLQL